ncbi:MAG: sigma-70 family RNA polymerase sigma factor [Firmicutes bacterium]|nr:sigma-70 family RNA polymerase sigma factor [Bacillota bacterium]
MDYADQYTEDIKLTNRYLAKYFPHLKGDEDIIAVCVAKLWEKRAAFDPTIAQYSTYAFKWLRQVMGNYNRKLYRQKRRFETISIYTEVGDDLALIDTIATPEDSTTEYLHEIVKTVLEKNQKLRPVITYFMQGYEQKEIAEALGLSRSQVSYLLRKFRRLCRKEHLLSER